MKRNFYLILSALTLLLFPNANFGQAPDLGAASSFALFTASGAFNGISSSTVTGDVGTHVGAYTPPGTLHGTAHVADETSAVAAAAVIAAYASMDGMGGSVIAVGLGGQTLVPGTYNTGAASTLNGDLTLNGEGNSNALFIIRIGGAFATSINANVILTNGASLCNVYWQING